MSLDKKLEELRLVLKQYEPNLKVWNSVNLDTINGFLYIEFTDPKSSNGYTSLIKEAPLQDIDRIIDIYKTKLKHYELTNQD